MLMSALDRKLFRDSGACGRSRWRSPWSWPAGSPCWCCPSAPTVRWRRLALPTTSATASATSSPSAVRAPRSLAAEIAAIDGVAAVEARIVKPVLLDIEGMREPATGIAISLPPTGDIAVNALFLREGRLPESGRANEVAVNVNFAVAHELGIGDTFDAVVSGSRLRLTIVGTVLSPEYVYAIGPGDLMPDDRRFGVMWMPEAALASLFDPWRRLQFPEPAPPAGRQRGRGPRAPRRAHGNLRRHRCARSRRPVVERVSRERTDTAAGDGGDHSTDLPSCLRLPHQHDSVAPDRARTRTDRPAEGDRIQPLRRCVALRQAGARHCRGRHRHWRGRSAHGSVAR
jgi:hypothetical protein